ncbi:MAG: ATP-binding cassette domain-containing protein [Gammaproteobacteria bacterium]|nr:ATP-binding cassette domain-containing protein [Gammaproteobacteria bacterium]NIR83192.1 ATP-binding cassette domain-containing protein [Gammaproteobacteria bacterium]NIR91000.1 ATP-binding cassette domain-containing protein [Gammaproteobacteria bacterium]NIU04357.1 ATP-binding cassette domain-containing protein [Gammaproteobacteria bacterium]NIV52580.1 ATP-binding cassette domain-containing protein [Gammaproteobacteria bacterium]
MSLFQLRGASAHYNGRTVLDGVSLRIEAGERVALIGRSGAGKSTLLKLLYAQQPEAALVPQDLGLVRTLSVFHNVYIGRLHRHSGWYNLLNLVRPVRREVEAVRAILMRLALDEKLFAPAAELSGGQQQRTAVGRALYRANPVFIADEPCSAIDERQGRNVLERINESHETVVLAMHDVTLALAYTDRVIGVAGGRIALDEPTRGMEPSDLAPFYENPA